MQRLIAVLVLVCVVTAPQAVADPIISNFSAGVGVGTAFGSGSSTVYKAFGWTMPAGDDYFLDAATLTMEFPTPGQAEVSIWDGASLPANRLITLDNPDLTGMGDFTFTPPSSFTMSAGETYWVYVEALPGADGFTWEGTDPSTMPSGLATAVGYIWNGSPSSYYNRLEISGTIVPEPASLAMLALAGLLIRRR